MLRNIAAAIGVAVLAACHHNPAVIQTGPDTYMAGATSSSGLKSDLAVTAAAMKRANAFCQKQGKVAQMTGNSSSGHQMLTWQNAQVAFICVPSQAASAPAAAEAPAPVASTPG